MLNPADDRGGALLFAAIALLVVAALGAAVLQRAQADLAMSDRAVERAGTETLVDVAVADAWGRIDAGAVAPFSGAGSAPTGDWSYTAAPLGDDRWDLRVEAGAEPDAVVGIVSFSRDVRHPYTLFAHEITTGALSGSVRGRVGATGDVVFGGRALGDVQELVRPDATCRGCDNPVAVELPRDRYGVVAPDATTQPCPEALGVITGPLAGGDPYLCETPGVLTVGDPLDLAGPVVLILGRDVGLDLGTATVNAGGSAADLVIIQDDPGGATIRATDADLTAMVVAPSTPMTVDGLTWRGSIDVRSFTAGPGAALVGEWDADLEDFGRGGWRVVAWDLRRG